MSGLSLGPLRTVLPILLADLLKNASSARRFRIVRGGSTYSGGAYRWTSARLPLMRSGDTS